MGDGERNATDDGERSLISPQTDGLPAVTAYGTDLQDPDTDTEARPPTPGFVYVLTFFSALGGFIFGYDTGVVSGAMLLLKREMHLDALWQELVVSSTVGAAALSALTGGFLNGALGRRVCILLASGTFTVGGVVLGTAPDRMALLLGRIIVGLGIGTSSCPVFCAYSS